MSTTGMGGPQLLKNPALGAKALYIIVFVSGAVLMGLEIAGAKTLAPSFGTSTFVWGAIIGMFMGALAAGYYVGGALADKKPSFQMLAGIVSLASAWIFVLPYVGPGLAETIARGDLGKMAGPLLASFVLFFFPSFLMGMVSPYSVKLNASSLAGVGGVAGRLYALSTFGSICGTVLTTFYLIPYASLSHVERGLGIVLLATALACLLLFLIARGNVRSSQANFAMALVILLAAGVEFWIAVPVEPNVYKGNRLLYYEDSPYHEILVTEEVVRFNENSPEDKDGGVLMPCKSWAPDDDPYYLKQIRRWLKFNENIESGTYPYESAHKNAVTYTDLLHLPVLWVNQPKRILVVGGGGGIIPTQYYKWYGTQVDVAEIDEAVQRVAKAYFDMPRDTDKNKEGINFYIGDGRQTIRRKLEGPYDVIVLDAYSSGGQIPFHLMTWEFLNEVKSKLAPNGVLVTNIISGLQNGATAVSAHNADLFLAEYKTLCATRAEATGTASSKPEDNVPLFTPKQLYVFPKFYADDENMSASKLEEYRNVIVIATQEKERVDADKLDDLAKSMSLKAEEFKDEKEREEALAQAKIKCDLKPHIKSYRRLKEYGVATKDKLDPVPILSDDYAPVDLMYRPVKRDEIMRRVR